jgi:hypothetical protein
LDVLVGDEPATAFFGVDCQCRLVGVFSDPVFYRGTVTDAGLVRPEGHLYLVEMSLIAVEVFVVLGIFVLRNPWIVWPTRGPVGQFWLVELNLRMVWGLRLP